MFFSSTSLKITFASSFLQFCLLYDKFSFTREIYLLFEISSLNLTYITGGFLDEFNVSIGIFFIVFDVKYANNCDKIAF